MKKISFLFSLQNPLHMMHPEILEGSLSVPTSFLEFSKYLGRQLCKRKAEGKLSSINKIMSATSNYIQNTQQPVPKNPKIQFESCSWGCGCVYTSGATKKNVKSFKAIFLRCHHFLCLQRIFPKIQRKIFHRTIIALI